MEEPRNGVVFVQKDEEIAPYVREKQIFALTPFHLLIMFYSDQIMYIQLISHYQEQHDHGYHALTT